MSRKELVMQNGPSSPAAASQGVATAVAQQREPVPACSESEERVADLRRRYLEGSYTVDAAQLSARIVDKHLER
ncbi:MAG TPA: flagellar biosynthesis anti-sigma factor FlgM [Bryobacteraceae bacterium]|nr:flagellar biosynthesis anti-sigma factor FlgM [Bryobacteraceae bacterium]